MPVALAAAALAAGGYRVLHTGGGTSRELRRALALVTEPKQGPQATRLLEQASRTEPAHVRAQAANVLASLLLEQGERSGMADAIRLYSQAIRLDPADDASKFDLELLLTLRGRKQRRSSHGSGPRHRKAAGASNHTQPGGAGISAGGNGY